MAVFISLQTGSARIIALITATIAMAIAVAFILRIQRMNSPENTLETLRTLATSSLAHANKLPQGSISTTTFAGLRLSTGFIVGETLRTPWGGKLTLARSENMLIMDLYDTPQAMCNALMSGAASLPGIKRAAVNTAASDERTLPIDADQIEKDCGKRVDVLRYFIDLSTPVW